MQTTEQPPSKAFTVWTERLDRYDAAINQQREKESRAGVTLPSKPSALIRVALADLRKVEALPDIYRVNMDVWHREHRGDAVCEVCVAGAMISQSLGARPGEHLGPEDFDQETTWKLYALNEFRVGNVFDGLCYLDRADLWLGADTRSITEYTTSPAGFHRDMQQLAADLEAVGL